MSDFVKPGLGNKGYSTKADFDEIQKQELEEYTKYTSRNRVWPYRVSGSNADLGKIAINFEQFFDELTKSDPKMKDYISVTCGRNGGHSRGSKHYSGLALDCTFRGHGEEIFKAAIRRPDLLEKYNLKIIGPNHGSGPHLHIEVNTSEPVTYVDYSIDPDKIGVLDAKIYYGRTGDDADIWAPVSTHWPGSAVNKEYPSNAIANDNSTQSYNAAMIAGNSGRSASLFGSHLTGQELRDGKDLSNREELISFLRDRSEIPQTPPPKMITVRDNETKVDNIAVYRFD